MIASGFLKRFAFATVALLLASGIFVLVIDPYGVSPLGMRIPGFNLMKPARLSLDRQIKPIEVWRQQPATVFLGTSRIHQSIDPLSFEGSRLAPAYNASIPASSLNLNVEHLKQYLKLDPSLRRVYVEIFFHNFLGDAPPPELRPPANVVADLLILNFSAGSVWQSFNTVRHNLLNLERTQEIRPGGFFQHAPDFEPFDTFSSGFPEGALRIRPKPPVSLELHESGFEAVSEFLHLAKRNNLEVVFLATPNHAFMEFYYDRVGAFALIERWLMRVSREANVLSFAQPNDWVLEEPARGMRYWNDPTHFSLTMGRAMADAICGRPLPEETPDNFMIHLTPDKVKGHVDERQQAARHWAEGHPFFAAEFDFVWGFDKNSAYVASGQVSQEQITLNGRTFMKVTGTGGKLERLQEGPTGIRLYGRIEGVPSLEEVHSIIAVVDDKVVASISIPPSSENYQFGRPEVGSFALTVPLEERTGLTALPVVRVFLLKSGGEALIMSAPHGVVPTEKATVRGEM